MSNLESKCGKNAGLRDEDEGGVPGAVSGVGRQGGSEGGFWTESSRVDVHVDVLLGRVWFWWPSAAAERRVPFALQAVVFCSGGWALFHGGHCMPGRAGAPLRGSRLPSAGRLQHCSD